MAAPSSIQLAYCVGFELMSCPTNIRRAAVAYRASLAVLAVSCHWFLGDYDTSTSLLYPSISSKADSSCSFPMAVSSAFDKWDTVHFIRISSEGYTQEHQHAFYPLVPLLSRLLSDPLALLLPHCPSRALYIIAGCLVSHTASYLSLYPMYILSLSHLGSDRAAQVATMLFAMQPSLPFTLTCYTESVFALASLWTLLEIERGRALRASLFAAAACSLRSNGALLPAFFLAPHALSLLLACARKVIRLGKGSPPSSSQGTLLGLGGTVAACTGVVFAASFHVAFAIFGASLYCSPPDAAETTWWGPLIEGQDRLWGIIVSWLGRGDAGVRLRALSSPRPWCLPGPLAPFSNAYSFVQGHYWGVGFLKYYQLQQLPNFLLALPILSLSIIDSTAYLLSAASQRKQSMGKQSIPHVFHTLFLGVFALLFVHVQISTRLIATSSPAIFWYAAVHISDQGLKAKLIVLFFAGYGIVGTLLFCTFLPWT